MGYAQAWKDLAADPWGEALSVRLYIRVDTGAGSNQLVELTGLGEKVIELSPIVRRRERAPGVVQGQTWQIRFTNERGTFSRYSPNWFTTQSHIIGEWVALQLGFATPGTWETVARGRVEALHLESDGSATLLIDDVTVSEIMDYELPRPLVFDERDAWASPVYSVKQSATSGDYTNAAGSPLNLNAPNTSWETFRIVFASTTTYNVVREDGTSQAGGPFSIAANRDFLSVFNGTAVVRVFAAGWAGAYVAGDEFVVYTCPQQQGTGDTSVQIVGAIHWCINAARGDSASAVTSTTIPDVIGSGTIDVRFDSTNWDTIRAAFGTVIVRGFFAKGTRVIDMVQGLLRIINASLFVAPTGQLALSYIKPQGVGATTFRVSGDPAQEPQILAARRVEDTSLFVNQVIYDYRALNFATGQDGVEPVLKTSTVDVRDATVVGSLLKETVDLLWAAKDTEVEAAANKHLNRFKTPAVIYDVSGVLELATPDPSDAVTLTEPLIDEVDQKAVLVEVGVDAFANEGSIIAMRDNVVFQSYAKVGVSTVNGPDLVF